VDKIVPEFRLLETILASIITIKLPVTYYYRASEITSKDTNGGPPVHRATLHAYIRVWEYESRANNPPFHLRADQRVGCEVLDSYLQQIVAWLVDVCTLGGNRVAIAETYDCPLKDPNCLGFVKG
jgi:hypothetical protein